jgi:prepilin-type N-terminal cleavage/methylation domain-containing protein
VSLRSARRAAFTLVELLISIVVSAVVLIAVYSFFLVQTRAYETQGMGLELDSNLRFSQDLLQKALQGAGSMSELGPSTCSYMGTLGDVHNTSYVVDETTPLECVQVIDSNSEAEPDQVTTVVPDGSTLMRLALGTAGGNGIDCHAAIVNVVTAADPSALVAAATLCASSYRFAICSDYGHPGLARSFIRQAPTCVNVGPNIQLTFPAVGATYTDFEKSCGSDELGPYIECAGAQIYTFYVANNSATKLVDFAPADHVLFLSTDLDFYMRSTNPGDEAEPTVAGDSRSDGLTTVSDIPLATGITDLQVSGCPKGLAANLVGCNNDANWLTEFTQASILNYDQYRVGLAVRSNKTFPGKQVQPPPVIADGHPYSATTDNQYMYRTVNFRVAAMPRLDSL